jgi:hypothetical protein
VPASQFSGVGTNGHGIELEKAFGDDRQAGGETVKLNLGKLLRLLSMPANEASGVTLGEKSKDCGLWWPISAGSSPSLKP